MGPASPTIYYVGWFCFKWLFEGFFFRFLKFSQHSLSQKISYKVTQPRSKIGPASQSCPWQELPTFLESFLLVEDFIFDMYLDSLSQLVTGEKPTDLRIPHYPWNMAFLIEDLHSRGFLRSNLLTGEELLPNVDFKQLCQKRKSFPPGFGYQTCLETLEFHWHLIQINAQVVFRAFKRLFISMVRNDQFSLQYFL